MHLLKTTTDKAQMTAGPPFGPGVAQLIADRASRMEIYGSDFEEKGQDFCEFVLYDETGLIVIDRRRINGY